MEPHKKQDRPTEERQDPDANPLLSGCNEAFVDALIEGISEKNSFFKPINSKIMNQKNFEYLRDQVKFTGFGENLENELKEKMQKQTPKFMLYHKGNYGGNETAAVLHFRKSDQTDMYFFNKYDLTLKQEGKSEIMNQTFYLNKDHNITLKEAYNLMNGRSVNKDLANKEGQIYNAWIKLDMKDMDKNGNYKIKQFHQNYGFDLEQSLAKLPIKELANEKEKISLLTSLQKGNRQAVTFIHNGAEQRHFVEANPQFKSVTIYDSNMQRLSSKETKGEKQGQSENNASKQEVKKENRSQNNDDGSSRAEKNSQRKSKKQRQSVS